MISAVNVVSLAIACVVDRGVSERESEKVKARKERERERSEEKTERETVKRSEEDCEGNQNVKRLDEVNLSDSTQAAYI